MLGKIRFISAGAGSGKTTRLTEILYRQLSSGAARPAGVIATTFTKKAAAELRERVRAHLLVQGDYRLAHAMGQARIGTVNSVCGALLERFAFEAGLPIEQQVLDESQATLLIRQSIDAVLDGLTVAELIRITNRLGIENWQEELQTLVNQTGSNDIDPASLKIFATSNATDLLGYFPKPAEKGLSARLLEEIDAALPTIEAQAKAGGKKNTADYLALLRTVARGIHSSSAAWSDWVKLSKASPEAALKPTVEQISALAARVAEHPGLQDDIRRYLEQMFGLCAAVLTNYAQRKRELGVLDFTDQEHLLLEVLDQEAVAAVLKAELDLLMVDEFQDTSPIQLALFMKLAQFAKEIYWVGDIKQAIYGFRGSDTELMQSILKALPDMGGEKEILGASWRSRPPLVALVNAVFSHAFSNSLGPEEIELKAERKDELVDLPFMNWMLAGKNKEAEITSLAAGIHQLVGSGYTVFDKQRKSIRPVCYGDIAILARSNPGVLAVASGLRTLGIPSATSQPGLLATPEAILALACMRRLNDASDTIATAEILSLADCQEPEVWVADRLAYLESGGATDLWQEQSDEAQKAHPLLAKLAAMRAALPLLAPGEALQAVIAECNLSGLVLRWRQNADVARVRLANLEALLALAAQYEENCKSAKQAATISGLILWLGEQADAGQDTLAEPGIDAVRVMTHHSAKGLEWPVVILMDLASDIKDRLWSISATSRSPLSLQDPLHDRFIRYWPWPFGAQRNVSMADRIASTSVASAFRETAIEESKRLLYVSMTRARDLLVLARSARRPEGEWIQTLEAPWLMSEAGNDFVCTPSGERIATATWALEPIEAAPCEQTKPIQLFWFDSPAERQHRASLFYTPSDATAIQVSIAEQVVLGERITLPANTDMTALGTAIHACIASSFTERNRPFGTRDVETIFANMKVEGISASRIYDQITAFQGWIRQRWGKVNAFAEYPVQSVSPDGQVLHGRLDLLLELPDGWVLIDHKSNPSGPQRWEQLAAEHGGQLAAYCEAIESASGKPVLESWLFFPVSGGAISIQFESSAMFKN